MWAIFDIQSTLNYGPHFWKLQKCSEVFKTLGTANEMTMPSLRSRGDEIQIEQFPQHAS